MRRTKDLAVLIERWFTDRLMKHRGVIPRPDEIDSRDSVLGQIMIQHGGRRFRHGNGPQYPSGLHG